MDRQVKVVSAVMFVAAFAVLGYVVFKPTPPATASDREARLAQQEAELGLPPWPEGGDPEQREARMLAKIEADLEQKKLRAYQQELAATGHISHPSPEEEAFLAAHKNDLPNLVIRKTDSAASRPERQFGTPKLMKLDCRDFGPTLQSDGTRVGLMFERKVGGRFNLAVEGRGLIDDADSGEVNAIDDDGTIRMGTYDIDTGHVFTVRVWKDGNGRLAFAAEGKALRLGTTDVLWVGSCGGEW